MKPSRGSLNTFESAIAFTLIELLVVVAIIAILASLLLPALARAKEAARNALCIGNLREISVATMHYSIDQNNRFPNFRSWLQTTNGGRRSGALFSYIVAEEIYLCPTDKREMASKSLPKWATGLPPFASGAKTRDYSYVMSCGMCHAADMALFKSPPQTMLFMEAYLATNDYGGIAGPSVPVLGLPTPHTLALRHGRKGNLIMSDLHIEHLAQTKAEEAVQYKIFWFPTDASSAPGNSDAAAGLK